MRRRLESVVTVPTEERELVPPRRCCSATAGGSPSMSSTFGAPVCCSRRRAYGATDSKYRRCASAYSVPKASEDLPEPETPVKATSASRGRSTSTLRRLCSVAPRTCTKPSCASLVTSAGTPGPASAHLGSRAMSETIGIETPDGTAEAYLTGAPGDPGVLLFIDAIGLRPQIESMADRIASWGYVVIAPNVFYRHGSAAELAPREDLRQPDARRAFFASGVMD